MVKCSLTTVDNPFDPIKQFDAWYRYDEDYGYHTCSYLARIAKISDQLSEEENQIELERAIDEIIRYDFMNLYRKVKAEVEDEGPQYFTA